MRQASILSQVAATISAIYIKQGWSPCGEMTPARAEHLLRFMLEETVQNGSGASRSPLQLSLINHLNGPHVTVRVFDDNGDALFWKEFPLEELKAA